MNKSSITQRFEFSRKKKQKEGTRKKNEKSVKIEGIENYRKQEKHRIR